MRTLALLTLVTLLFAVSPAAAQDGVPAPTLPPAAPMPKRTLASWSDAMNMVRSRSTTLHIAHADVARAEAQSRAALAGVLPTINLVGVGSNQMLTNDVVVGRTPTTPGTLAPTPTPRSAQGTAQIIQPVLAVQAWHAMGTASIAEDAARSSVEDVRRQIVLSVASSVVAVVAAERIAELNRAGMRDAIKRLELSALRKQLGGSNGLDLVRAQQDVEGARAAVIASEEALVKAREALGIAIGIPEAVGVPADIKLDGFEKAVSMTCARTNGVDDRPDVTAQRLRAEAADHAVGDVARGFIPTVALQSTMTTTTLDTGPAPQVLWNVQAVLTVPLWDGGVRYAALRNARATRDIADQTHEAVRRNAILEIEQARRAVTVAEAERKNAGDSRALAAEAERLARAGYVNGSATSLELFVAAAGLRQAEVVLALRDFALVRARILATITLAAHCAV